jgi:kinesin family member 2/24
MCPLLLLQVTERNPVSSRSHAICTLAVTPPSGRTASLRLVDLAGSERNYETSAFTAADHRESAQINFALMALKDCFRAYHCSQTSAAGRDDDDAKVVSDPAAAAALLASCVCVAT